MTLQTLQNEIVNELDKLLETLFTKGSEGSDTRILFDSTKDKIQQFLLSSTKRAWEEGRKQGIIDYATNFHETLKNINLYLTEEK